MLLTFLQNLNNVIFKKKKKEKMSTTLKFKKKNVWGCGIKLQQFFIQKLSFFDSFLFNLILLPIPITH